MKNVSDLLLPTLRGTTIYVRPLTPADFDALFHAASDPEIWAQHSEPDRYKMDVFKKFFDKAVHPPGALVVIDISTNSVIGSSRYYGYSETKREVVCGYTFLVRSKWGGPTNRELKYLMLDHAFGFVDRVVFHTSESNHRSRKALKKLGATQTPGIFDIPEIGKRVEFSLLKEQWAKIKKSWGPL
jgi:RimJ/RimL family protein N-acetyltransferase